MSAARSCRCQCGYTCGRECGLPIMECMEKHYERDCDHKFNGEVVVLQTFAGYAKASSVTCSKCGSTALDHDVRVGP